MKIEYRGFRGTPRFCPKGRAAGQGRHDLREERATTPGTDGADNSIAPQAMTGNGIMILPMEKGSAGRQDMVVSGKIAPAMPYMILAIVISAVDADEVLGFSPGGESFRAIRGCNKYDGGVFA